MPAHATDEVAAQPNALLDCRLCSNRASPMQQPGTGHCSPSQALADTAAHFPNTQLQVAAAALPPIRLAVAALACSAHHRSHMQTTSCTCRGTYPSYPVEQFAGGTFAWAGSRCTPENRCLGLRSGMCLSPSPCRRNKQRSSPCCQGARGDTQFQLPKVQGTVPQHSQCSPSRDTGMLYIASRVGALGLPLNANT